MKQALITLEDYPYGYCEVGKRFYVLKCGNRTKRVSWIAALKQGNLFAPITFVGSCNRDLFERWLEQYLVPQLQPGDVIVIDNASFHHSQVKGLHDYLKKNLDYLTNYDQRKKANLVFTS